MLSLLFSFWKGRKHRKCNVKFYRLTYLQPGLSKQTTFPSNKNKISHNFPRHSNRNTKTHTQSINKTNTNAQIRYRTRNDRWIERQSKRPIYYLITKWPPEMRKIRTRTKWRRTATRGFALEQVSLRAAESENESRSPFFCHFSFSVRWRPFFGLSCAYIFVHNTKFGHENGFLCARARSPAGSLFLVFLKYSLIML